MLRTLCVVLAAALLLAGAARAQDLLPPPRVLPPAERPAGPGLPPLPLLPPTPPSSLLPPVAGPPPRCLSALTPGWGWRWPDHCETITPGALPQPNGWFLHQWNGRMKMRADADNFVIYRHEWYMGGVVPGPYGTYHLDQIARWLAEVPFPVLIQIEGPPDLNETRRQTIIGLLTARGVPDAEHRVVVGYPDAEGLRLNDLPRSTGGGGGGRGSAGGAGGGGNTGAFGIFGTPGATGAIGGTRGY